MTQPPIGDLRSALRPVVGRGSLPSPPGPPCSSPARLPMMGAVRLKVSRCRTEADRGAAARFQGFVSVAGNNDLPAASPSGATFHAGAPLPALRYGCRMLRLGRMPPAFPAKGEPPRTPSTSTTYPGGGVSVGAELAVHLPIRQAGDLCGAGGWGVGLRAPAALGQREG